MITEISVARAKTSRTRSILGLPSPDDFERSLAQVGAREVMVRRSFRARWFVWRAALPISIISGLTCEEIISGRGSAPRRHGCGSGLFFFERSMVIWICRTIGDISFSQIGSVIDRKHSAAMSAFKCADDAIAKREPKYFDLLTDVLYLEDSELGSQKGHFIRSNRG